MDLIFVTGLIVFFILIGYLFNVLAFWLVYSLFIARIFKLPRINMWMGGLILTGIWYILKSAFNI